MDYADIKHTFADEHLIVDVMRRKFSADGIMHIYQRTIHGFNLFYSLEDFLVFYTIVSVQARKFKIYLWGMCMMVDHIHILASAEYLDQISGFISASSSIYIKDFNSSIGRKGSLFEPEYGSALKIEMKKIRSAVAYLFNNPVEKLLCRLAEGYRWNFLQYYDPERKISIPKRKSLSRPMQRALKIIDNAHRKNEYLKHALLINIMRPLDKKETEMLTDYIITLYFPFIKTMPQKFFRSYNDMVIAVNSNTGSEYDIDEKHYCKTDVPYRAMTQYLKKHGIADAKSLITESEEVKRQYYRMLREETSATPVQIRKFLHIKP